MTRVALTDPPCLHCGAPCGGLPFCTNEGTCTEPFVVGDYRVHELIGRGATSFVFGGYHQVRGTPIALRLALGFDTANLAFLEQARAASRVVHENLVRVLDTNISEIGPYLVMERLHGTSLADRLRESGRLDSARGLPVLLQIALGLEAAHAAGIPHGSLSARNVMLVASSGASELVKLCDLGLLGDRTSSPSSATLVCLPDELSASAAFDTDIVAFGRLAYQVVAGRLPKATTGLAAALDMAPRPLAALILRCLDPASRPRTIEEIVTALVELVQARSELIDLTGQTIGNYRILERIATGGTGIVYVGEHPQIKTKVAIKVLKPEVAGVPGMCERFVQEARASSEIASPHMLRYHDFGTLPNGQAYAVMELLDGETLGHHIARRGRLQPHDAREILLQLASVLELAHAAGIIHRDIKPENIFLARTDTGSIVKLLDFGIAKVQRVSLHETTAGVMIGTPLYCAPEQALGHRVGPSTDVYALGTTAFEMLTGRVPFDGDLDAVMRCKLSGTAPSLDTIRGDLPSVVVQTIAKMLARDPAERGTIADVAAELRAWPAGVACEIPILPYYDAGPPISDDFAPPKPTWRRAVAVLACVVAIAVAFVVTAWARSDKPLRTTMSRRSHLPVAATAHDAPPLIVSPIVSAASPTVSPAASPTVSPAASPTVPPAASPTVSPAASPTVSPIAATPNAPSNSKTEQPIRRPAVRSRAVTKAPRPSAAGSNATVTTDDGLIADPFAEQP